MVDFGISFNQLLDLDEKKQIMTSSVWIHEGWTDEGLQWNPCDYDGLNSLVVSANRLWLPDLFIFNSGGGELDGFINVTGSKVKIMHTGYVTWVVPLVIKSACSVDVTYFPYDRQHCEIHFGSWIYDVSKLDLRCHPETPNLDEYVLNNEFDLQDYGLYRTMVHESCCPGHGDHPMINFFIQLKRKSIYYDYIVIAPTLNLCFLTLVTFMLPCHHGDKIAIGLTVFLTLYVLQLLIAENVPDTNTTPILGIFIFLVMTLNCISLILATMIMSVKKRANLKPVPEVPKFVLRICETYLSRITCTSVKSRLYEYNVCDQNEDISACPEVEDEKSLEAKNNSISQFQLHDSDSEEGKDKYLYESNSDFQLYNHNFQTEDTLLRGHSSQSALLDHDHSQLLDTPEETENNTGRCHRKRPSYKRAIHRNPILGQSESSDDLLKTIAPDRTLKELTKDEILALWKSNHRRKREWYFVAETMDKSSFLVYTLSMFITIFTVLVLVPNLQ
ncbi:hypothetical protein FSP39_004975 [Pinctada imbricata]|uniref:Neuronal acetylcholine receptor subunit alpha-10-like n=1 Tax=Pinctada imbricata TaxID=66713 RepID=A0AA88Y3K3_PINIB|nr:hypothetical protein FSP39_004975 [Pinctada imbricata]